MSEYTVIDHKKAKVLDVLNTLGVNFRYKYLGKGRHPLSVLSYRAKHSLLTFEVVLDLRTGDEVQSFVFISRFHHSVKSWRKLSRDDRALAEELFHDFWEGSIEGTYVRYIDGEGLRSQFPEDIMKELDDKVKAINVFFRHVRQAALETDDPFIQKEWKRDLNPHVETPIGMCYLNEYPYGNLGMFLGESVEKDFQSLC